MRDSCADNKQQHPKRTGNQNASIAMAAVADAESDNAQRDDDDQHLKVQVRFRKLGEKWQSRDHEGQGEAMHQAQGGKDYRRAIEPIARFLCILIHRGTEAGRI